MPTTTHSDNAAIASAPAARPPRQRPLPALVRLKPVRNLPCFVPMVDVFFLLLLFLLLGTSFVQVSAIKIDLPQNDANWVSAAKMVVSIDGNGRIYFNDMQVTLEELRSGIASKMSKGAPDSLVLRADRNTPHELCTQILWLANDMRLKTYFAIDSQGRKQAEVKIDTQ